MSLDTMVAPGRPTVDFAYYFGQLADTLDWGSAPWITFEKQLKADTRPFEAISIGEVMRAVSATRGAHPEVPGTFVDRLIGPDDFSKKDLFRVIRRLLRIYDLRIVELLELIDILERCPGTVEDLSVRNLLALISVVDTVSTPLTPAPVVDAMRRAANPMH